MINVWEYSPGDEVLIRFIDGEELIGIITSIDDEDESGLGEDGISISTREGRYVGLGQSEIVSITVYS